MQLDFKIIEADLRKFLISNLPMKTEKFSSTDILSDIFDFDSLAMMQIVFYIESNYPMKFSKNDFDGRPFKTLSELATFIKSRASD